MIGVAVFIAFLGAAAVLAWSSEPIAIKEPPPRRDSEPAPSSPFVDLVPIPGGSFQMGSPEDEVGRYETEGPVHWVTISPFACARYPVTRRLYSQIMETDPGWPEGETNDRPVNNVSWKNAVAFCNELSQREGLPPCYKIEGEKVTWNRATDSFRLLTEAEWEYSCRAGSTTRWSFGDDEDRLAKHAWYEANSNGKPQPVGKKEPNPWGLHDMHGNVYEWCWDRFGPYAEAAEPVPAGPEQGDDHVLRGGAFDFPAGALRSAVRVGGQPTLRVGGVGFRCARGPSL